MSASLERGTIALHAPRWFTKPFLEAALVPNTTPATGELVAERYRVQRRLGSGGMGEAYLAEDILLQRKLVLKRLTAAHLGDSSQARHLITEAKRASAVESPHVAQIYDVCLHQGEWLLAMEYVAGSTLRAILAHPLTPERFFALALQLTAAIEAAHASGVLHCDIKPENVMVTDHDFVKVLDFGLAQRMASAARADETVSVLAAGAAFAGTPGYIAPEVLRESLPTERSDIFSLGVVLYEMAGGASPFKGASLADSVQLTLAAQPAPLAVRQLGLPQQLSSLLAKALEKQPERRYATVRDLLVDLRACEQQLGQKGSARARPPRFAFTRALPSRAHWPWLLVFVSALAALVPGGILLRRAAHATRTAGAPAAPAGPRLLAVIPFRVIPENAALSAYNEGLRESITASLAHVAPQSAFEVLAASEVRAHALDTPEQAHKELGADLVVDGSFQHYREQVRVTFSLDDAAGRVLHSENVTSTLTNPFELEDRVIRGVLTMLDVRQEPSSGGESRFGTSSPQAYDAYLRGIGYLRDFEVRGNLDQALTSFRQAVQLDPQFAAAYAALGEAHWQAYLARTDPGQIAVARENCARGLALNANVAEVHICLGTIDAGTGQTAAAQQEFLKARQLDPQSDTALSGLAGTYQRSGQPVEAEHVYRQAIEARPHYWANYYALADFLLRRAEYAQASSVLESAARQFPANSFLARKLGVAYFLEGRLDDSAAILEKAIAELPHAEAYMDLGQVYLHQRQFAPAIAALEQASRLEPNDFSLRADLADAYHWSGHDDGRAEAGYREALALALARLQVDPRDPDALMVAAYCSSATKSRDEALKYLALAFRSAPSEAEVAYYAARVYARLGDDQAARQWTARAIAEGYSKPDIATAPDLAAYSPGPAPERDATARP